MKTPEYYMIAGAISAILVIGGLLALLVGLHWYSQGQDHIWAVFFIGVFLLYAGITGWRRNK